MLWWGVWLCPVEGTRVGLFGGVLLFLACGGCAGLIMLLAAPHGRLAQLCPGPAHVCILIDVFPFALAS